jgi:hypothetical protein
METLTLLVMALAMVLLTLPLVLVLTVVLVLLVSRATLTLRLLLPAVLPSPSKSLTLDGWDRMYLSLLMPFLWDDVDFLWICRRFGVLYNLGIGIRMFCVVGLLFISWTMSNAFYDYGRILTFNFPSNGNGEG